MKIKQTARAVAIIAAIVILALAPLFGAGPSFHPDATFKGSSLAGWHVLGDADWRAQDGVITGVPKQPGGGWLVLDKSYQDIGFYAAFRCATGRLPPSGGSAPPAGASAEAGCKTGILLRAEKTASGMKGVYVSLTDGDIASYAVTLDAQGKELQRQRLRPGGGQMRIAPPVDPNAPARGGGPGRGAAPGAGAAGRGGGGAAPPNLPLTRPDTSLRAGEWNDFEIELDANIVRAFLNGSGEIAGGVADDDAGTFGPVALYVGGDGRSAIQGCRLQGLEPQHACRPSRCRPASACSASTTSTMPGARAPPTSITTASLDVVAGPAHLLRPGLHHVAGRSTLR